MESNSLQGCSNIWRGNLDQTEDASTRKLNLAITLTECADPTLVESVMRKCLAGWCLGKFTTAVNCLPQIYLPTCFKSISLPASNLSPCLHQIYLPVCLKIYLCACIKIYLPACIKFIYLSDWNLSPCLLQIYLPACLKNLSPCLSQIYLPAYFKTYLLDEKCQ